MKCPNCGREIANDSQFCEFCGTKISKSESQSKTPWIVLGVIFFSIIGLVSYQVTKGNQVAHEETNIVQAVNPVETTEIGNKNGTDVKKDKNAITIGETWSYTEHISDSYITTYFVFTSKTNVTWLFGTPFGNVFPVGFGKYSATTNDVTFSGSDKLHKRIALYYGEEAIVFHLDRDKCTARYKLGDAKLDKFYNGGYEFAITREKRKLIPNKKLVGSKWLSDDGEELYFKTVNEVVVQFTNGESEQMAYVCIGDMVAIKTGDNIDDENAIGKIVNGNEATLCREGLSPERGSWCVTMYKQ